jgi:YVTN family beta-propeller protein
MARIRNSGGTSRYLWVWPAVVFAHAALAVLTQAQTVFVANFGSSSVSVMDAGSNTVIATILVGLQPFHVEVSPDGQRVYVTNRGSNTVSVGRWGRRNGSCGAAAGVMPIPTSGRHLSWWEK